MLRAAAWTLLLTACGGGAAAPADLAVVPADLAPGPCTDPNPPAGSVCPLEVTGVIAPESGITIDKLPVSVCAGLCFFGAADATGAFRVVADAHVVVAQYALEVHGRPSAISYYAPLPSGTSSSLAYATPMPLLLLPPSGPAIAEDASAQTLSAGDLTLAIPTGTKVQFSVEDFGVAHGHELRVRRVDAPATLPFVSAAKPPAALYALSPFEAAFSLPVPLTLANTAGLPAGAAIDVQVLSGLLNDGPPAGRLIHAASAHVSADGTVISTDPGQGIVELTWLALVAL